MTAGSRRVTRMPRASAQSAPTPVPPIARGPFVGTRDSLRLTASRSGSGRQVRHLGALGAAIGARAGRLVCPQMYIQGDPTYKWHLEHFGPQSKVGFKDVIPTFKGEKFDPEHLMDLYQKAGAKYFFSMGCITTTSTCGTRSIRAGTRPTWVRRKTWWGFPQGRAEAGLKFGVSEHLWISWSWFGVATIPTRPAHTPGSLTTATIPSTSTSITTMPKDSSTRWCIRPPGDFVGREGPRFLEALTTSTASRTWWTTTSPIFCTPTAAAVRGIRPQPGGAPVQRQRAPARRPSGSGLQQQAERLRRRHVRAGFRARPGRRHRAQPLADRHCIGNWHYHRASSTRRRSGDRHAGGYREPERQPAAELPAARERRAGRQGTGHSRRLHSGWR